MRKWFFVFLCFSIFSCQSKPREPKTLRLAFTAQPTTLDPRKGADFASATLICLLSEGLMRSKEGKEIEPGLAEKIEVDPEGLIYTFHLRPSTWSDGTPVTASDFERTWKSALTPGFPCLCPYLFYPIRNAEKCAKGELPLDEVGIVALDAGTLQVVLEQPTPYFLDLTAFPTYAPVHLDLRDQQTGWDVPEQASPISNGPFLLDRVIPNGEIHLRKNPTYWKNREVFLDRITIAIVPSDITALQMFERKEIDLVGGPLSPLPPDALSTLQGQFSVHQIPMAASTFCIFNTEAPPFTNETLRKAFCYAIDREILSREMEALGQIPATRPLPPPFCQGELLQRREETVENAKTLLQQALEELHIAKESFPQLTLYYKTSPIAKRLAQTLQMEWKKNLDLSVKIEEEPPKNHLQRLHERAFQISIASWIAQFPDPMSLLERFKDRKQAKNYAGWSDKRYVHYLEQASQAKDPKERTESLLKAEEILRDSAILAPLYHWNMPALFHPHVERRAITSNGGILFEKCSVKNCSQ